MSGLALLYMAVMPLLAKRYAEKWCYYAWLAIVIGLIVPFRPHFGSALIQLELPNETIRPAIQAVNGTSLFSPVENPAFSAVPADITWWQIAFVIWLSGAALFLAYRVIQHYRFVKMAARWSVAVSDEQERTLFQDLKSEMGIKKRVGLYRCSCVNTPMLIGLAAPRILLPDSDFAADELRFIIKHELAHYMRKDLWCKCLVLLATAIHWFNPVVYLIAKSTASQCEISCDALVLKGADFKRRKQYGEAIIGIVKNGAERRTALSTNFYGGKSSMKNRIYSIMDTKRKKAGVAILCLAVAGSITAGAAFAATAADERTSGVGVATAVAMSNNQTGQISVDNGQTWIDEEGSLKLYTGLDIVWWTYDEYKAYVDEQKETLPNLIGEMGGYYDEKGVLHKEVWTQEKVDEAILGYERELEYIKNGGLVSKPTVEVYDENELRAMGINIADSTTSVASSTGVSMNIGEVSKSHIYGGSITLGNGEVKSLGIFATEEERLAAVQAFCDEQIKADKMTRREAEKIFGEFK
jgi:beta-lactamase regulating signal transducer with metallopeptidase domain